MFGDPVSNTKGWEKKSLNKVVTDDCTISYGIVQTGEEQKEGISVFRPVDIVNNKKPKLEELKKTTEEISNRYKKTILQGNELLMTVRANIGDVCVINEEFKGCNVGRGIVPIRVKEEVNTVFLKQQFESYRIQKELKALAKGITLIQLNMEDLREFMIIVPPIELQNQFADFVKQVDKLKFKMQNSLKELQDNFREEVIICYIILQGKKLNFLKLEKESILRIFRGDSIVQIILNKQKSGLEEIESVLQLTIILI